MSRIAGECLGNLDQLLLRRAEPADRAAQRQRHPELVEEHRHPPSRRRPVDRRPRPFSAGVPSGRFRPPSDADRAPVPGRSRRCRPPAHPPASGTRPARRRARSPPCPCRTAPPRILISVDLPAPFSPSRAWTSPARRSKSTPSSAVTPGNRREIPRNSSSGSSIVVRRPSRRQARASSSAKSPSVERVRSGPSASVATPNHSAHLDHSSLLDLATRRRDLPAARSRPSPCRAIRRRFRR